MSVGFVIGLLLGTHPKLDNFFSPWIILWQNLPALVVIVLCYLWIGLNETAAILAVCINKTAMVAVTIREGSKNFSRPIFEMAKIYKMSKMARLRYNWLNYFPKGKQILCCTIALTQELARCSIIRQPQKKSRCRNVFWDGVKI